MAQVELIMPKMGESIMEATILKWLKNEGDSIELEESVLEIATDKVDSEVPSPVEGTLLKILYNEGDTIEVGKAIAIIQTGNDAASADDNDWAEEQPAPQQTVVEQPQKSAAVTNNVANTAVSNRFYSPLVLNMARKEGISMEALEAIAGTGKNGRVTKKDMQNYIASGKKPAPQKVATPQPKAKTTPAPTPPKTTATPSQKQYGDNVEVIGMDRMRQLIAKHMVNSVQTSPHVTSFVEVDMTDIVNWRNGVKKAFQERTGDKITFTPIFVEAVAKAITDFPLINSSVDGTNIIVKKDINIGMAAALPSGNLIVPVIRNADYKNLVGLTKTVNDLANRARNNKLKPSEIEGGTFTLTNVGSFGSLMGTPIINQPQVAILAVGIIRKMPAVVETEYGDVIAIRQKMIMSLSYDHRIVDGALGSKFLSRVKHYLEAFDKTRTI
ncbi:MAG: dihydrolipoamide acetyltransferase family protein [Chitinophagales bacterium]